MLLLEQRVRALQGLKAPRIPRDGVFCAFGPDTRPRSVSLTRLLPPLRAQEGMNREGLVEVSTLLKEDLVSAPFEGYTALLKHRLLEHPTCATVEHRRHSTQSPLLLSEFQQHGDTLAPGGPYW